MSPRRRKPSKHTRPASDRPLLGGTQERVSRGDGDWIVRRVSGTASTKTYRCPGCDQLILPNTPHVVVWPEDPSLLAAIGGGQSLDERRHWHTTCWQRRR
ncbi:hypothetical protein FB561_6702 [Kribbella amoyensis]|uniref:ATP/GTP-binding protein n=1 Tax=Kribbella amoyensis TaxID=996641 RepID=A0A561B8I5_9ACTN|nr:hypothetical protein [Kribbella amoyensis]TWD75264.1 hypothetical protein FB561_6702 [Kribbella amoyensis]